MSEFDSILLEVGFSDDGSLPLTVTQSRIDPPCGGRQSPVSKIF
jgi:hypothetical protein